MFGHANQFFGRLLDSFARRGFFIANSILMRILER